MSDFLVTASDGPSHAPIDIFVRLLVAMLLGGVVTLIYRRTRYATTSTPSFTVTLVLLTILIAMVTQVIGDNVARAFSLVGALSIVRFRTVVRDTQDTAYVIFAVAVGMAIGAGHPWLAIGAIVVIGFAAFVMRERPGLAGPAGVDGLGHRLEIRLALASDPRTLVGPALTAFASAWRLQKVGTARQGMALEVIYDVNLKDEDGAGDLVKTINRLDGVQAVTLQRAGAAVE